MTRYLVVINGTPFACVVVDIDGLMETFHDTLHDLVKAASDGTAGAHVVLHPLVLAREAAAVPVRTSLTPMTEVLAEEAKRARAAKEARREATPGRYARRRQSRTPWAER